MERHRNRNSILATAERWWDRLAGLIIGRRRDQWQIGLQTYRTFGTPEALRYACRVLRDPELANRSIHDSFWQNLRAAFHTFESDEIADAQLSISHSAESQSKSITVQSNEEGYACGSIPKDRPVSSGWQPIAIKIDLTPHGRIIEREFAGECLVPSEHAKFGMISDIDDTVLHSQVTSVWRMLLWSITHNAYTRVPLPGVGRLYRQLTRVDGVENTNPVFYVSSSPWNLYSMLVDFLDGVDLPKGPLMLRDLGIGPESALSGNHEHKGEKVEQILRTYPRLPFILFGDSGQQDPEIYSRIAEQFPDRILCVYIRNAGRVDDAMMTEARRRCERAQCPMLLVSDSKEIALHAEENGWIESRTSAYKAVAS